MKKFIITENQLGLLQEFIQDGFNLDDLDKLTYWKDKVDYCTYYLGNHIGRGCGRYTFDLTDDLVIKISIGTSTQNELECKNSNILNQKYDIFPIVYRAAKDYSWIICERVIQFRPIDSDVILGIPYSTHFRTSLGDMDKHMKNKNSYYHSYVTDFANYQEYGNFDDDYYNTQASLSDFLIWARYYVRGKVDKNNPQSQLYFDLMYKNKDKYKGEMLKQIFLYIDDVGGVTDICAENMGIAMRNGKPTIVVLDCGADKL